MIEVLPNAKSAASTSEADVRPAAPTARCWIRSLSGSGGRLELDDRQVSRPLEVGDHELELGATTRAKRRDGLLAVGGECAGPGIFCGRKRTNSAGILPPSWKGWSCQCSTARARSQQRSLVCGSRYLLSQKAHKFCWNSAAVMEGMVLSVLDCAREIPAAVARVRVQVSSVAESAQILLEFCRRHGRDGPVSAQLRARSLS